MIDISRVPFPLTYRQLYLPRAVNQDNDGVGALVLPSSVRGGSSLSLSGAQKRTTVDGVHFTGAATSNIVVTAVAGQNLQQAFHITIRFKLDMAFAAGAAADLFLFQKRLDANNWIRVYLRAVDGMLVWQQGDGAGGIQFTLTSTTVSWTAGTWYVITVSLTNTPTQRLLVNGTLEDSDVAAAVATPNGGDMVIGSSSDGGTDGVIGVISWVLIGVGTTAATALSAGDETDLNAGLPPATAKVQYMFLMDEGRGSTVYDRGSAGGNGTLDSAVTWAWGQVKRATISFDSINDQATTGAGLDGSGAQTLIWAGKAKSVARASDRYIYSIRNSDLNWILLLDYNSYLRVLVTGNGTSINVEWTTEVRAIDDYVIYIVTIDASGVIRLFKNGYQAASNTGATPRVVGGYILILNNSTIGTHLNIHPALFFAQIEGAFSVAQVLRYSRWLRDVMNLPITI